jgi:hypothetical protein
MYVMYYASTLRCWQLIRILVRTNHPYLRVGCHTCSSATGERGRTSSVSSSMKHSTSMYVPMQSIVLAGDGGEDASWRTATTAGRRTSKKEAQAPVCGTQCLREGLMSSIYRSRWSRAPFLHHHLGPLLERNCVAYSATEELF